MSSGGVCAQDQDKSRGDESRVTRESEGQEFLASCPISPTARCFSSLGLYSIQAIDFLKLLSPPPSLLLLLLLFFSFSFFDYFIILFFVRWLGCREGVVHDVLH